MAKLTLKTALNNVIKGETAKEKAQVLLAEAINASVPDTVAETLKTVINGDNDKATIIRNLFRQPVFIRETQASYTFYTMDKMRDGDKLVKYVEGQGKAKVPAYTPVLVSKYERKMADGKPVDDSRGNPVYVKEGSQANTGKPVDKEQPKADPMKDKAVAVVAGEGDKVQHQLVKDAETGIQTTIRAFGLDEVADAILNNPALLAVIQEHYEASQKVA